MLRLPLQPSRDISELQAGWDLVAFDAGPDGAVYLLFAEPPSKYRAGGGTSPSFAVTQPSRPQTYRAVVLRGGAVDLDLTIAQERFNIHHFQPLGDLLLLVCARAHYRRDGESEHNGRLYSREGELVGEILLGDGIQDVQTTVDGTIWTSYFDEGIFGNFGWDHPLGASGLVAWDRAGTQLYEFEPAEGLGPISDCYAMNVASADDVWLCYYTGFPLVHLRSRKIRGRWQTPVGGSSAFAIGSGHCLFQGGYRKRDEYVLAELGSTGKEPRIVKQFQLTDFADETLSAARTAARGERLYILADAKIYQLDVASSFAAT